MKIHEQVFFLLVYPSRFIQNVLSFRHGRSLSRCVDMHRTRVWIVILCNSKQIENIEVFPRCDILLRQQAYTRSIRFGALF